MTDVFADTSYFIALLNSSDHDHQKAVRITRERSGRLITTVWVLTELANFLRRGSSRQRFGECYNNLSADPSAVIVLADQTLWEHAVTFFLERPDKQWSLTDCLSFVVMNGMGITEALTADVHFQQAGFRALLLDA